MKALLLLLLSLPVLASSPSCYKALCPGDTVRDLFGWRGVVVSLDSTLESVEVALSHLPTTYSFAYSELGKSVMCFKKFCQGMHITNLVGDELMIEEVYTHKMIYALNLNTQGRALYKFNEVEVMQ